MPEYTYKKYYDQVRKDVNIAIESFCTHLEIHNIASADSDILKTLNKNSTFWNITLASLQANFFIALSRVFDDGGDTISIHKLIKHCVEYPEIFSREALEKRKLNGKSRPDWLDEYLDEAYYPTAEDLRIFYRESSPIRKDYDGEDYGLRRIRSEVIAHNITTDKEIIEDLFKEAEIAKIQYMLKNLDVLLVVLRNLYINGQEPKFGIFTEDFETRISDTTKAVLESLK